MTVAFCVVCPLAFISILFLVISVAAECDTNRRLRETITERNSLGAMVRGLQHEVATVRAELAKANQRTADAVRQEMEELRLRLGMESAIVVILQDRGYKISREQGDPQ